MLNEITFDDIRAFCVVEIREREDRYQAIASTDQKAAIDCRLDIDILQAIQVLLNTTEALVIAHDDQL